MAGRTGLTEQTEKRIVFDAGEVRINYEDPSNEKSLGATRGGATLTITGVFRDMPVDGTVGKRVKGLRRKIRTEAQLQVTLLEMTTDNFLAAIPGATSKSYPETTPTHDEITGGPIVESSYLKNVVLLANKAGTDEPFIVELKNVLADGNVSIQLQDEDEAGLAVTFLAFYDPANLDEEPWSIRNPLEAD